MVMKKTIEAIALLVKAGHYDLSECEAEMKPSFDEACRTCAKHFIDDEQDGTITTVDTDDLAQLIQDTVEGWFREMAPVRLRRDEARSTLGTDGHGNVSEP